MNEITLTDVLGFLIPDGGYVVVGDTFEGIEFVNCKPLTKSEVENGFEALKTYKLEQFEKTKNDKAALLAKLGITEAEAKLLLS
jgi:hypothetical protein